jgi:hypothetical protein
MKKSYYTAIGIALSVSLIVSCASAPMEKPVTEPSPATVSEKKAEPAPIPTAEAAPKEEPAAPVEPVKVEPVKIEPRVITVRIPMERKSSIWFSDGSLDEYTISERDASGSLVSQTRYTASGSMVEKTEFTYAAGRLVTKTQKDAEGKLVSKRSYQYTPTGELVMETLDDGAGKRLSSFAYEYEAGFKVKWIVKDSRDSTVAETLYDYKDGKIRKSEMRDGAGKKTGGSVYEYSAEGRLEAQKFHKADGSLLRVEASIWKDGIVISEERRTAGGAVQQKIAYEYGPDGEVIRKIFEDLAGKSKLTTTFEYTVREEQRTIQD